jgi:hypothetical protein
MYVGRSLIKNCHVIIDSFLLLLEVTLYHVYLCLLFSDWLILTHVKIYFLFYLQVICSNLSKKNHRVQRVSVES